MHYNENVLEKEKMGEADGAGEIYTQDRCGVNLCGVALSLGSLDPGCKRS